LLWVFWFCIGLLSWHYLGYPIFLYLLAQFSPSDSLSYASGPEPSVSIIIIAHNEEDTIAERIRNCIALDYPRERQDILVASDGSTDRTVEVVRQLALSHVAAFDSGQRCKAQTRNWAVEQVQGEIVCFTDADTRYEEDCLRKLVRHYADPSVGCVGGELISGSFTEDGVGEAQGLYWKYEYLVRRLQSDAGLLAKVSGANMSMRRDLYHPVPATMDIDQLAGPMTIMQGYRVVHDSEAIALEEFPTHAAGEYKARVRLTIRALTALWHCRQLMNIFRYPLIAVSEFSGRVLRYAVPLLLILVFSSNIFLLPASFYILLLLPQVLFYLFAVMGMVAELLSWPKFRGLTLPFSFCLAETGMLVGVLLFLLGRRITYYHAPGPDDPSIPPAKG
jgi:cellulose synthase/poly-beta-1,6-N-acetylglucosamine synthase-like glycosyltransferase